MIIKIQKPAKSLFYQSQKLISTYFAALHRRMTVQIGGFVYPTSSFTFLIYYWHFRVIPCPDLASQVTHVCSAPKLTYRAGPQTFVLFSLPWGKNHKVNKHFTYGFFCLSSEIVFLFRGGLQVRAGYVEAKIYDTNLLNASILMRGHGTS